MMKTKKLKKILAIIFCICLAIYFAYAVILLIIHPTEIYVITKGEIKEEEETVGYIIRNETVIKDEDNLNGIYAITTEGQKVAKDEVVFRYYKESEKETTENQIILTWVVDESFTAVSGQLLPEIVGQKDDTVVIKYEMTPMVVRNSILEQYNGGIDAIDKALREMQSTLAQAEQLIAKMPIIKNGTWWIYDATTGNYQDSGQSAKGDTGTPGKDGINGKDGKNGADGYSPTATVTETDTGATITITDKNGTTTATVKNGTSSDSAIWGDYTPGCEEGESAKYCTAKLVTVTGKQTWQVLPSISTVSHNALDIVPDGLFVLDLSPDVDTLKASAHTHDNKDFLDGIETYLHSTYSKVTAEREAADNSLATRIKALEDSIGDISTALATMVEV